MRAKAGMASAAWRVCNSESTYTCEEAMRLLRLHPAVPYTVPVPYTVVRACTSPSGAHSAAADAQRIRPRDPRYVLSSAGIRWLAQ